MDRGRRINTPWTSSYEEIQAPVILVTHDEGVIILDKENQVYNEKKRER
jgi:phosphoribosylformylglycinamidine (FGAM) synthase-like amidotransferase family enzyme